MGATFRVSVTFEVDTSPLDALMPKTKPTAEMMVKQHAYDFEALAKLNAPVYTGNLRNSISTEGGGLEYTVSDGVDYGVYQEFGVNHSYEINSPVNIHGHWVYIGTHPGFKAHPFFTPAAEKVGSKYFVEFWERLLG